MKTPAHEISIHAATLILEAETIVSWASCLGTTDEFKVSRDGVPRCSSGSACRRKSVTQTASNCEYANGKTADRVAFYRTIAIPARHPYKVLHSTAYLVRSGSLSGDRCVRSPLRFQALSARKFERDLIWRSLQLHPHLGGRSYPTPGLPSNPLRNLSLWWNCRTRLAAGCFRHAFTSRPT